MTLFGSSDAGSPRIRTKLDCFVALLFSILPLGGATLALLAMPESRCILTCNRPGQIVGLTVIVGQLIILLIMFGGSARAPRRFSTLLFVHLLIWPLTALGTLGPVGTGAVQSIVIGEGEQWGLQMDPFAITRPRTPQRSQASTKRDRTESSTKPTPDSDRRDEAVSKSERTLTRPPRVNTPEAAARRFMYALVTRNIPEISRTGLSTDGAEILYDYSNVRIEFAWPTLAEKKIAVLNEPVRRLAIGDRFDFGGQTMKITPGLIGPHRAMITLTHQLLFVESRDGVWKVDAGPLMTQMKAEQRNREAAPTLRKTR